MKPTKFSLFLAIIATFSLVSCRSTSEQADTTIYKEKLTVKYAQNFTIEYADTYKKVTVKNPWKIGQNIAVYYLVKNDTIDIPQEGIKITIPLENIAVGAVTHLPFLDQIGEMDRLIGFCEPHWAYNPKVHLREEEGKIVDLGSAYNLNIERLLSLKTKALMMSAYAQENTQLKRLQQMELPVIYNVEWMENSPLGRAEWGKFVATFFDKEQQADSIFTQIENRYNRLKKRTEKVEQKPSILSGNNFRGTWYLPGGNSYMATLFHDAGANYRYANDSTMGSLPMNIEKVLKEFEKAQYWVNCNFDTKQALIDSDNKTRLFTAFKNDEIYNFNKRKNSASANDFWENGVARPDLILSDLIKILHPELLPKYELYFAKHLD